MPLSDTIKTLIRNAWDDGYPCPVGTYGPQGPNVTPKGGTIMYDDERLVADPDREGGRHPRQADHVMRG